MTSPAIAEPLPAEETRAQTTRGGKRAIGLLAFAQSIDFTEPQILNSMYPAIQASLNLADSALGYLTAVKRGIEIFSVLFWGLMSDRFRRKEVLAASTLLGAVASILTGIAPEFAFFFVVTMMINLGTAAMEGQTNSVLSDFYPVKERGKAFGLLRGLAYSGLIFALIYFSVLADNIPAMGWRIAYWTFGIMGLIASITIWRLLDEPTRGQTEQALANVSLDLIKQKQAHTFSLREAFDQFRVPTIIVDCVNLILLGFPKIMLVNFSVTFFVKVRDIREGQAILITLLGLIGFIVGSMTGGVVGDRIGRRLGERARLMTGHLILVLLVIMTYLIFGVSFNSIPLYMAIAFVTAFCVEFMYSITRVVVSTALLPEVRTVGFSIGRMADSFGSILASLIYAAVVGPFGIANTVLWLSTGGGVVALVLYFGYYFTFARDAERMQRRLAERVTSDSP